MLNCMTALTTPVCPNKACTLSHLTLGTPASLPTPRQLSRPISHLFNYSTIHVSACPKPVRLPDIQSLTSPVCLLPAKRLSICLPVSPFFRPSIRFWVLQSARQSAYQAICPSAYQTTIFVHCLPVCVFACLIHFLPPLCPLDDKIVVLVCYLSAHQLIHPPARLFN